MEDYIIFDRNDKVCSITINRPKELNVLSADMLNRINQILNEIRNNEDFRFVVLRGTGEQAFCAGFELTEPSMDPDEIDRQVKPFLDLLLVLHGYPKPIISLVQGYALGGGCVLSAAADITIATKSAIFSLPELGLGIGVLIKPVLEAIGKKHTLELLLTRKRVNAEQAVRLGLVNEVTEDLSDAESRLKEIIQNLMGIAPHSSGLLIPVLREAVSQNYKDALHELHRVNGQLMLGTEFLEGVKSFRKKETPPWNC